MTHLLIVEEREDNRALLETLLEANGYRVAFAGDGVEALARELEDTIAQLEEAKRKLQESEARFRSLTEMASDFYWESDAEHRLVQRTSANRKLSTVSVFRVGAQIGERRWNIPYLSPDAAGWAAHRAVLDAHLPFRDFELSRLGVDGTERFISISGDPVFDAAGAFTGYRGVGTDITERKRAEEEIRALARFPSENPNPVLRVGRDGVLLSANESSRSLLAEWACAVGQAMPPFWRDLAAEALGTNLRKTIDVELAHQTYSVVVAPVREGGYVNLYGHDITERKRLEATLKTGEALLKDMGHMAAVGGWEFDLAPPEHPWDELEQRWTEEIYRILEVDENYSPTVGKSIAFYVPASRPIIERAVRRAIADGTSFDLELELITAKGNLRWVHAVGKADRELGKIVGTFQDITERKRHEQDLRRSQTQLREAQAERQRLSRNMHDGIVQNIYAVGLGLEQVQRQIADDPQKAKKNLADAIKRLNTVIREARNYIVGLEPQEVDWMELFTEFHAVLRAATAAHGMRFSLDAAPLVLARFSARVAREVLNIVREAVSNSLRHSGGKQGLVSLRERDGRMVLTIEDDGAGFDVLKPRGPGQGLRNITARAQALSAELDIRSSPGHGTRVIVNMPLEPVDVRN